MTRDDWLSQLDHENEKARTGAAQRIAASGDASYLEPLAGRAASGDPEAERLFCRYLKNMPEKIIARHLPQLLQSQNLSSRATALQLFSLLSESARFPVLFTALRSSFSDVALFAISDLSKKRKTGVLKEIAKLITSGNADVSSAALDTLRHNGTTMAARLLTQSLKTDNPIIRAEIINRLGGMSVFKSWNMLLPELESQDARVKAAAISCISRKARKRAFPHFLRQLNRETDDITAKMLMKQLTRDPGQREAEALARVAYEHQDAAVRRAAVWALDDVESSLVIRVLARMLKAASDEERQVFLLTLLGQTGDPQAGAPIASFIRNMRSERLRYAAIEALGSLRDMKFLTHVTPLLFSSDPMEAYVATLSTVQMAHGLQDCPDLIRLMLSEDPEHEVLIQVVLQYMQDAISWDFGDESLIDVFKKLLKSQVQNIRYHTMRLVGRTGRNDFLPPLVEEAMDDSDPNIQAVAVETVDELLNGDTRLIVDRAANAASDSERANCLVLASRLRWNLEAARHALERLAGMKIPAGRDDAAAALELIVRNIFSQEPEMVKTRFCAKPAGDDFHAALGRAWLSALQNADTVRERLEWKQLLTQCNVPATIAAVDQAVSRGAVWAVDSIVDRMYANDGPAMKPRLRAAVKKILEL